jgi:hypothetical protein
VLVIDGVLDVDEASEVIPFNYAITGLVQMEKYWAAAQEVVEKVEQLILNNRRPVVARKRP